MDKKEVAAFFDFLAPSWDADTVKCHQKIDRILDIAGVTEGKTILDVACGTGVLIPEYINRNIKSYVGIDISHNMIEIAKSKFSGCDNVELICADAEIFGFKNRFDCIVIYNAFPHFANRSILFENLAEHLSDNGRITIAHSMSREALIKHHSGKAKDVSSILPEADELAEKMKPYFDIDTVVSNSDMYVISGKTNRFHSING